MYLLLSHSSAGCKWKNEHLHLCVKRIFPHIKTDVRSRKHLSHLTCQFFLMCMNKHSSLKHLKWYISTTKHVSADHVFQFLVIIMMKALLFYKIIVVIMQFYNCLVLQNIDDSRTDILCNYQTYLSLSTLSNSSYNAFHYSSVE